MRYIIGILAIFIITIIMIIILIFFYKNPLIISDKSGVRNFYKNMKKTSIETFVEMGDIIPKTLYLTYKTIDNIPNKVFDNWSKLNPEYNIEFYDDSRAVLFLLEIF